MDEPTDRSSSSASDFEVVRENDGHRPEQTSNVCWIKEPFLQKIKSFSSSWLTVSLLVLLLGQTIEYKRVNDINQLMSVQLKDLRQDYDQLKMHDTNQQLQILTELRALRECGRPETIDEPKEVARKTVEIESKEVDMEPKTVIIELKAEHLETEIKEEIKTTVEPQPTDIQGPTEVKPNEEPIDEQKQSDDPNDLHCSPLCEQARKDRNSIKKFWNFVVSNPIDIFNSICRSICRFIVDLMNRFYSSCFSIWKMLTIELVLTFITWTWLTIPVVIKLINEERKPITDQSALKEIGYFLTIFLLMFFAGFLYLILFYIRLLIVC
ncbi:hypothetical protein M3Y95_00767600 [Aphelenchoides besseyi]|nr:hypothetical protein M3Y95_00767600 [Aphelenchoides besseyi]